MSSVLAIPVLRAARRNVLRTGKGLQSSTAQVMTAAGLDAAPPPKVETDKPQIRTTSSSSEVKDKTVPSWKTPRPSMLRFGPQIPFPTSSQKKTEK